MNLSTITCTTTQTVVNPAFIYACLVTIIVLLVAVFCTEITNKSKKYEHRIAEFEKIRYDIFKEDFLANIKPYLAKDFTDEEIREIYDGIQLPKRGTAGAAGYDFYAPLNFTLKYGDAVTIPTGIRCRIEKGWDLEIVPRSGSGFKYGLKLANTTGIIDSDYYSSERDGHIMVKLVNNDAAVNKDKKDFELEKNKGFAQGLFRIFGITETDDAKEKRINGFGSSDKK